MIQPNELRIGNYVQTQLRHRQQKTIQPMTVIIKELKLVQIHIAYTQDYYCTIQGTHVYYSEIAGIKITEKILLQFGFCKVKNINGSYELDGLRIHSQYPPPHKEDLFNSVTEVYYYEHPIWCFDNCKYLHKLQNIYYLLKGKELTLKNP